MTKYNRRNIPPEYRDYQKWPLVDLNRLSSPLKRQEFLRRRDALTAYMDGLSESEIIKLTEREGEKTKGFRRDQVLYYLNRCLKLHGDGNIWGFRGLVPGIRQKTYERTKPIPYPAIPITDKGTRPGYAGVMGLYLREHPEIAKDLTDQILNRRRKDKTPEQNPAKTTTVFGTWCRKAEKENPSLDEYPHNVDYRGQRSISNFANSFFVTNTKEMIDATYGADVARNWGSNLTEDIERSQRCYQRVTIDPHLIKAKWTIEFQHPFDGEPLIFETDRIWVVPVYETKANATLGYKLAFNPKPDAGDILGAIENALSIWKPRDLTINGLEYPEGSGFPSGVIPGCAHALWDETFIDNAWELLAFDVTDGLMDVVGSDVNAGIAGVPNRRPFLERFHATMEWFGFRQLPVTAGSGPGDAKRTNPSKNAFIYQIKIAHLIEIIDVVYASLNGREGLKGTGGRSPLQVLRYYAQDPDNLLRRLGPGDEDELMWLAKRETRTVRGSVQRGERPHIEYKGAIYSNPILADAVHLLGKEIEFLVKPHKDIRSFQAFRMDGTELGQLEVRGHWADSAHNLKQRKIANKLINDGIIASAARGNPMEAAKTYFASQAHKSKRAATQLANFQYALEPDEIISIDACAQNDIVDTTDSIKGKKLTGKPVIFG